MKLNDTCIALLNMLMIKTITEKNSFHFFIARFSNSILTRD